MHHIYKAVSLVDIHRIIDYCQNHTIQKGGLFEVYPDPNGSIFMVIVNSSSDDGPSNMFRPLGGFYCNHAGLGVISIEEENPYHDDNTAPKRNIKAIKQVIDILLAEGFPGTEIRFNDLPGLCESSADGE